MLDITKPIDDIVVEVSELIATRARTQSKAVLEFVGARPRRFSHAMIGSVQESHFEGVRNDLMWTLREQVAEVMKKHNHAEDVAAIGDKVRDATLQTATMQGLSAASVGGLMALNMLDVTGVASVSTLALLSLLVVPWRKSGVRCAHFLCLFLAKGFISMQGYVSTCNCRFSTSFDI